MQKPPEGGLQTRQKRKRLILLDLRFFEFDVLLRNRIVFALRDLVGHRARILLGHVKKASIRCRKQFYLDRGGLCHNGYPFDLRACREKPDNKSRWSAVICLLTRRTLLIPGLMSRKAGRLSSFLVRFHVGHSGRDIP